MSDAEGWAVIEGHTNVRGMTASTSRGRPFSVIVRPTIEGSAPNRRVHRRSLNTTADGSATFLWNGSPRSGRAPSVSKNPDETLAPLIRSASPRPVNVNARWLMPA